jgi:hypothetical protein
VGPYGAQRRLQQPLQSPHTTPSTPSLQYVEPPGGAEQVPNVLPAAMLQMPPQQSPGLEHTSPGWMQNDDASAQVFPLQSLEQHWPLSVHALPAVLQVVLRAAHMPPTQSPLQQELALVQAWPSDVQVPAPHLPLLQLSEQQSVLFMHAPSAATHLPRVEPQTWFVGSQLPEQH